MQTAARAQWRSWPVQTALGIVGLILASVGRALTDQWWQFVTPILLAACAIWMLVRGRSDERLLVASACVSFLVVLAFALILALTA